MLDTGIEGAVLKWEWVHKLTLCPTNGGNCIYLHVFGLNVQH